MTVVSYRTKVHICFSIAFFYVFLLYKTIGCFRFVSLEKTSVTNMMLFISKACEMNMAFSGKVETNVGFVNMKN